MKLTIAKSALLDGLQTVQNVVGIRSTLPVLGNVLFSAEKKLLSLTTTDLDVSVRCGIEADITKSGTSTLPVRRLSSIVRELPDTTLDIEIDEKDIATIKCGSSIFRIIGMSEEEFPPIPKPEGKHCYNLNQRTFKEMLKKTSYAASADETRFVLNGVFVSFKGGKVIMVATDGRRLALAESEEDFPKEAETEIIIPSKAVTELLHTLGDEGELKLYVKENQTVLEFDSVLVATKLIDGTYPNYKQVIPSQCSERISIERESLLSALKRASLIVPDKSSATRLTFGKNKLVIMTSAPDVGEAKETLPVKYSGKEITVAFNAEYMMDPLRNLSNDEIAIELTDDLSPGVIKCDIPFLYVLMPMRIS